MGLIYRLRPAALPLAALLPILLLLLDILAKSLACMTLSNVDYGHILLLVHPAVCLAYIKT